ncbi:MAG: hypothetical protein CM15mP66_12130 [Pseudomonadota bacterium]|nr:MAG: hypothetical protein CM15mP66_12130 [Pseudomonadota bacterium]
MVCQRENGFFWGLVFIKTIPKPKMGASKKTKPKSIYNVLGDNVYGILKGKLIIFKKSLPKTKICLEKFKFKIFHFFAIWGDHDFGKKDLGKE